MMEERKRQETARPLAFGAVPLAVALAFTMVLGCGGGDGAEAPAGRVEATATPQQVVGYAQTGGQAAILYPNRSDRQNDDTELADGGSALQATWEVKATFKTVTDTINDSVKAVAGKRFVVYEVSVTNRRQSEALRPDREFKLIDPSGEVVRPYAGGMEPVLSGTPDPLTRLGVMLLASESKTGLITFEAPDMPGWHYLTFKSRQIGPGRLVWGIEIP